MTFWSGARLKQNKSVISEFSDDQIDCNNYTIKMGRSYYRTADKVGVDHKKIILADGEPFIIPPGQFAYLLSKEEVNIPVDAMAFISMRTIVKFQGLINVSGFHVDPGYRGKLIFAVFNAGSLPVQICQGDKLFKIWFCDLDEKADVSSALKEPGITDISNELVRGMSKEILSLQSLAEQMRQLDASYRARFAEIKFAVDFLNVVFRGIVIAVMIAAFTLLWPFLRNAGEYLEGLAALPSTATHSPTDGTATRPKESPSPP